MAFLCVVGVSSSFYALLRQYIMILALLTSEIPEISSSGETILWFSSLTNFLIYHITGTSISRINSSLY